MADAERVIELEKENAELRAALAYAIKEADGWYAEARGGERIEGDEEMDKARRLLTGS
jgi:hypothetical protein